MPAPYTLTITNPGAETGDMTGWTSLQGAIVAASSGTSGLTSNTGSFHFEGSSASDTGNWAIYYQDIDVSTVPDSTSELDDESLQIDLGWSQANSFSDDTGMMYVEFYDGASNQISHYFNAPAKEITPEDTWELRTLSVPIPVNTRTIRIHMAARLIKGSVPNSCFDDIDATLTSRTVSFKNRHAVIKFRNTTGSLPSNINEALGASPSIANLVDQDGVTTGWSLSTNDAFDSAGDTAEDFFPFGPNIYGDGYLLCDELGDQRGELEIGGLDTAKTYRVRVAAYRSKIDRDARYEIQGNVSIDSGITDRAFAYFDTIEPTGLVPDASGNIRVIMETPDGVSRFGYLNAVEIEENVAPPPTGIRATREQIEIAYTRVQNPGIRATRSVVEVAYSVPATPAPAPSGQTVLIIIS